MKAIARALLGRKAHPAGHINRNGTLVVKDDFKGDISHKGDVLVKGARIDGNIQSDVAVWLEPHKAGWRNPKIKKAEVTGDIVSAGSVGLINASCRSVDAGRDVNLYQSTVGEGAMIAGDLVAYQSKLNEATVGGDVEFSGGRAQKVESGGDLTVFSSYNQGVHIGSVNAHGQVTVDGSGPVSLVDKITATGPVSLLNIFANDIESSQDVEAINARLAQVHSGGDVRLNATEVGPVTVEGSIEAIRSKMTNVEAGGDVYLSHSSADSVRGDGEVQLKNSEATTLQHQDGAAYETSGGQMLLNL